MLSRQGLPHPARTPRQLGLIARGGYVLQDPEDGPIQAVIMASGSEVGLALNAAQALAADGIGVRVVSMPNPDLFEAQDAEYRESVLPAAMPARLAIEAGVSRYWRPLVGDRGHIIGIDRFGASAPADQLFAEFGFTTEAVRLAVRHLIGRS